MSKPRYSWWAYAKNMVRRYPELKKEYDRLHTQSATETAHLPPARQVEYDAVRKAIEQTTQMKTGKERLAVVDMVLWKGTHNVAGAATKLYLSERTARAYHGDFIRLVGFNRGLEDWQ